MEVAKQRLTFSGMVADAEEVGIERIGKVACSAARVEGVGGPVEQRPLHEDEVFPRRLVPVCAGAGEREVFQMK